jgi:hypothetical protein
MFKSIRNDVQNETFREMCRTKNTAERFPNILILSILLLCVVKFRHVSACSAANCGQETNARKPPPFFTAKYSDFSPTRSFWGSLGLKKRFLIVFTRACCLKGGFMWHLAHRDGWSGTSMPALTLLFELSGTLSTFSPVFPSLVCTVLPSFSAFPSLFAFSATYV